MRYVTRDNYHRLLGPTVEVWDTRTKTVASLFTRDEAWQRATTRAEELNAEDDTAQADS